MNIALYSVSGVLLLVSALKDKKKTVMALKKSWKAFENILPEFVAIIILVGIVLAVVDTETITKVIGADSGYLGVFLAATIGAITLIPGFVAFPLAFMLLQGGAGYMQIGAFVSALMMVGVVTMPVEMKYFGKKMTIYRNLFAFIFSFVVALVIQGVFSI